ncbi:hypothetical protein RIR_jg19227.t1 [Rhizophagus irregularis DAOM 181602=DAOM 197198]|nr:hypothetical protein RIR_jg19227.t1 [Rhizophagus irregularis DAOM 181602=DAOM 197198]
MAVLANWTHRSCLHFFLILDNNKYLFQNTITYKIGLLDNIGPVTELNNYKENWLNRWQYWPIGSTGVVVQNP